MKIEKPKLKTMKYLDYHECVDWIQQEHGVNLRDGEKKQDYWKWILESTYSNISNGCFFGIPTTEWIDDEDTPEWVKDITKLFVKEFGKHMDTEGDIEFWVGW